MTKRKHRSGQGKSVRVILLGLSALALLIAILLRGKDVALFNPKGLIAGEQSRLIVTIVVILLAVAIPTLSMLYFFAWKYRETNEKAKRDTPSHQSRFSAFSLWVIPCMILLLLASVMIPATHRLDPHKAIASDTKALRIQVVAMRWKWLFIYPEQNIATVNFVQIPSDTPVEFDLTADEAPMNSFWVPHLGGQLYAMTGHSNRLNLMADTTGDYTGQAAEINGEGFSGMKFTTRVSSQEEFDSWAQDVRHASNPLDFAAYSKLLVPSENNPVAFYSSAQTGLYDTVLLKYGGAHGNHAAMEGQE
jgi:cytochrome o ubiquinol oxidase subunit II